MTWKIRACCRGFQYPVVACVNQVQQGVRRSCFMVGLDPSLRKEEMLCDYHQLLMKSLSSSEREESTKQL